MILDCYCQSLISGRETTYWAMCPPGFEVFLIFLSFLKSSVLVARQLVRKLVHQICYSRYQISWRIGPVLKVESTCRKLQNVMTRTEVYYLRMTLLKRQTEIKADTFSPNFEQEGLYPCALPVRRPWYQWFAIDV